MENQLVYDVTATERLNENGRFNIYYNIYPIPTDIPNTFSDRYYFSLPDVAKEILKDFTLRSNSDSSLDELIISGLEETDTRIHIKTKGGKFVDHLLDRLLTTEELRELYVNLLKFR